MKAIFNIRLAGVALLMGGIVAAVGLTNQFAQRQVERAVSQNFVAAGVLAKIQVQAERMRRYEKEMFIYAAVPDRQAKYAKEFDEAHTKLLQLQNEAASLKNKAFSDADRALMAKWMDATTFYTHEFGKTAATARSAQQQAMTAEQRLELTLKLNSDIGAGKDRFRDLLDGAAKMREAKEAASLTIGEEINAMLRQVWMALAGLGAAVTLMAAVVFGRRAAKGAGTEAPGRPAGAPSLRATAG